MDFFKILNNSSIWSWKGRVGRLNYFVNFCLFHIWIVWIRIQFPHCIWSYKSLKLLLMCKFLLLSLFFRHLFIGETGSYVSCRIFYILDSTLSSLSCHWMCSCTPSISCKLVVRSRGLIIFSLDFLLLPKWCQGIFGLPVIFTMGQYLIFIFISIMKFSINPTGFL